MAVDCDGSAGDFGGIRRECRERLIVGVAMLAGLLFCGAASAQTVAATKRVLIGMPDTLLGAWHSDDDDGRLDCKAYRKIKSARDITEETGGLVGALMITSKLLHAYSDYGEGDFYVVKRVILQDSQRWDVDALVGVDSMPEEGMEGSRETFRLTLSNGVLSMNEENAADGTRHVRAFFKCGNILDGMYIEPASDKATEGYTGRAAATSRSVNGGIRPSRPGVRRTT
ncbi:MAG: hypothetical protein EOP62_21530 [Sphingomonadales bacterium]|nr:MAG: hypothetical protein EOP62_21530 [Sphingomonadales bacterium]